MKETYSIIEEIKLEVRGEPPVVISSATAPASLGQLELSNVVRRRMRDHFVRKTGVEAVRLLASNGTELFRWDWFNEQKNPTKDE